MNEFKYKNDPTRAIVQNHSTECSAYPDMIIKAAFVVNKINSSVARRAFHLFFSCTSGGKYFPLCVLTWSNDRLKAFFSQL